MKEGTAYYGDCFDIISNWEKEGVKEVADLIYGDPPFNSNRNYGAPIGAGGYYNHLIRENYSIVVKGIGGSPTVNFPPVNRWWICDSVVFSVPARNVV